MVFLIFYHMIYCFNVDVLVSKPHRISIFQIFLGFSNGALVEKGLSKHLMVTYVPLLFLYVASFLRLFSWFLNEHQVFDEIPQEEYFLFQFDEQSPTFYSCF